MFKSTISKENLYKLISFGFVFVFTINLFLNNLAMRFGICNGIKTCLNVLIPALFPFVFITNFIVETNLSHSLGRVFSIFFKKLYNLPESAFTVIVLSLIGGYPAGAVGIKSLIKQKEINKKQAEQMAYFCVCSGPAYVINIVGMQIYNSFKLGLILLLAQVLSMVFLGAIVCNGKKANYNKNEINDNFKKISNAFVNSCQNAASSMGNICAFVVLFSGAIFLISSMKVLDPLYNLFGLFEISKPVVFTCFSSMLEITNGTINFSSLNYYEAAFFLGFGGLCVHFQIISLLNDIKIKYIKFFLFRVLQGLLAALFSYILIKIFPTVVCTSASLSFNEVRVVNNNSLGSAAIILMSFILIISTRKNNIKLKFSKAREPYS